MKRIIRNTLFQWTSFLISLGCGLFLSRILIIRLGDTIYGLWALFISIIGYVSIFDISISAGLRKYIAEMHSQKNFEGINEYFSSGIISYLLMGIFIFAIGWWSTPFLLRIFHVQGEYFSQSLIILYILWGTAFLSLLLNSLKHMLSGMQRFDFMNITEIIKNITRVLVVYKTVTSPERFLLLAWIHLGMEALGGAINLFFAKKIFPILSFSFRNVKKLHLQKLLRFSIYSFIAGISARLFYYTDNLVIGAFLSSAYITHYVVAWRLVEYMKSFVTGFASVLLPVFSGLDALQKKEEIKNLFITSCKFSALLSFSAGCLLIAWGREIFELWLGVEYRNSYAYLLILTLPQMFILIFYPGGSMIYGMGRLRLFTFVNFISALTNIGLSIFLVRKIGLIGVALGTAFPLTFFNLSIMPLYYLRLAEIRPFKFLYKILFPFLGLSLFYLGVLFLVKFFITFPSFLVLVISGAGFALLFAGVSFLLVFSPEEREKILEGVIKRKFS